MTSLQNLSLSSSVLHAVDTLKKSCTTTMQKLALHPVVAVGSLLAVPIALIEWVTFTALAVFVYTLNSFLKNDTLNAFYEKNLQNVLEKSLETLEVAVRLFFCLSPRPKIVPEGSAVPCSASPPVLAHIDSPPPAHIAVQCADAGREPPSTHSIGIQAETSSPTPDTQILQMALKRVDELEALLKKAQATNTALLKRSTHAQLEAVVRARVVPLGVALQEARKTLPTATAEGTNLGRGFTTIIALYLANYFGQPLPTDADVAIGLKIAEGLDNRVDLARALAVDADLITLNAEHRTALTEIIKQALLPLSLPQETTQEIIKKVDTLFAP